MPGDQPIRHGGRDLPVAECFPEIIAAVGACVSVVLKAPPGAGKTTGVPPELIRHRAAGDGQILLIQPRRLAARAAAVQLARRMETRVGDAVGYHVRFDKKVSAATKLIAMTTGVLLRRLIADPLLDDVSCVILDEFHERSLEIDLAMGMLHRIRTTLRPELRLMVMSATLESEPIAAFLGDAVALRSEGRTFPVEIRYAPAIARDPVGNQVAEVLPAALRSTAGDVLVFLPGVGEIHSTRRAIEAMRLGDVLICELFGSMSSAGQDAVLEPATRRKIILATNVAETSITIPGVTAVIDSGLARVLRFDSRVGLPKLQLEPISQASADQRAGRAGRTEPGCCFRLWSEATHRSRRPTDDPEILRADFSSAFLTLAAWGERDVFDFPWLVPPQAEAVDAAKILLRRLDAIDPQDRVTALGQQMLELPLHPRLARMVIEASKTSDHDRASLAAALLTERSPFRNENPQPAASAASLPCDLLDRVLRLERFRAGDDGAVASPAAAQQIVQAAKQIARSVQTRQRDRSPDSSSESFQRSLLSAYPDRVARRRRPGEDRGVMVGGRGVKLDRSSSCRAADLFLCLDVDSAGSEALVRMASAIDESWLDERLIRQVDEPFFHPSLQAVVARRRRYYEDLLLRETPIACESSNEVAELLFQHAALNVAAVFPSDDREVSRFIGRVGFLSEAMPESALAPLGEDALRAVLRSLCQTRTSIAELRTAPWLDYLRARYDYETLRWIDTHAPARITLPSGNSAVIHYEPGKRPWMEVRIQELFGWLQTPRIAGGRVPVQLHLLGPNYKPQQITEDLTNFWKETYTLVRKELRRRYPKHHWPEEPTTATATARGLKPKP